MLNASDKELVQEFAENNSEAAFSELVSRYINLVYSVALRYTGNAEDAQDVTQAVFIILAKKAGKLRERTVLTGWLYETTRLTAASFLRARARRQTHEQEAFKPRLTPSGSNWPRIWKRPCHGWAKAIERCWLCGISRIKPERKPRLCWTSGRQRHTNAPRARWKNCAHFS